MTYLTKPLEAGHKRSAFCCGKDALDNYIKTQAKQDMKRRLSVVFVLSKNDNDIEGYYTLSSESIDREIVPESIMKKMPPSYTKLPVTLLGRLAIDKKYQGQNLGRDLLIDALKRTSDLSKTDVGSMAVIVDPLDAQAVSFYEQYGFITLPDRGRMFLPMKTIDTLF